LNSGQSINITVGLSDLDISVKLTHQYGDTDPPQTGSIFKNHLA
jgi:hypothetical protein